MRRTPLVLVLFATPLVAQFIRLDDKATEPPALTGEIFFFGADAFPALERAGVSVPERDYTFWAWAHEDRPVSIFAGDAELYAPPAGEKAARPRYVWRPAGTTAFARGKIRVDGGGEHTVAAICLARAVDVSTLWPLLWTRPFDPEPIRDARMTTCRHINKVYETWTYPSKDAWLERAGELRRHILVACGLWPPPARPPIAAEIFGTIERDTYAVEKVFFESWPGVYVTGNLYRPRGAPGPYPAVLCPHGHWGKGRFTDEGEPTGGVPMRSITLAKLGCIAFSYDMVGYGDSKRQFDHTFASEENELWGTSLMKLQLWNALRGIDFLTSLPDVDRERIACTGASGGGTQTFMLMAIDDRVKVAAPVNMVSASMQGGCECENAPLLRLDTINPEIASLMAPRPLLLVSATGDWTSKTPTVEYPMVRGIYTLFGAAELVKNVHIDGPHNYNRSSREAVYNFFLKHLCGRDLPEPYKEPPYTIEKLEDLSVWAGRDLPAGALDRRGLEAYLKKEAKARLLACAPRDRETLERFRADIGSAYRHVVFNQDRTGGGPLKADVVGARPAGEGTEAGGPGLAILRLLLARDDQIVPATLYLAREGRLDAVRGQAAALIVHPAGKAGLVDAASGKPGALVEELLRRNASVLAIDAFLCGEFNGAFGAATRAAEGKLLTTYNRTTLVERVRDIVLAATFLTERVTTRVAVVGQGAAGKWVALAGPFLPPKAAVLADLAGYACDDERAWRGEDFAPSILAVGGVRTAAALSAPRRLILHGAGSSFHSEWPLAAYTIGGAVDMFEIMGNTLRPDEIAKLVVDE